MSILGNIWNKIEDLAYGEPPEGVSREDWVKEQMARDKQQQELEAASRERSAAKERAKTPRCDEDEEKWHDRLDSSGFWHQG
jgi:hypothetical protein